MSRLSLPFTALAIAALALSGCSGSPGSDSAPAGGGSDSGSTSADQSGTSGQAGGPAGSAKGAADEEWMKKATDAAKESDSEVCLEFDQEILDLIAVNVTDPGTVEAIRIPNADEAGCEFRNDLFADDSGANVEISYYFKGEYTREACGVPSFDADYVDDAGDGFVVTPAEKRMLTDTMQVTAMRWCDPATGEGGGVQMRLDKPESADPSVLEGQGEDYVREMAVLLRDSHAEWGPALHQVALDAQSE